MNANMNKPKLRKYRTPFRGRPLSLRTRKTRKQKRHVTEVTESLVNSREYAPGYVETVEQFLARGGTITRVPVGHSRHLTEEQTLLVILNSGTDEDANRGFAWSDLVTDLRARVRRVYQNADRALISDELVADEYS